MDVGFEDVGDEDILFCCSGDDVADCCSRIDYSSFTRVFVEDEVGVDGEAWSV